MNTNVQSAPFPRLRRPLNITVVGEMGLTDGVALWLDENRMDFLLRERLDPESIQLVRVDLAGFGQHADLNVQLVRILSGRETPFRKGWFHSGTWNPLHFADRDTVEVYLEKSEVVSGSLASKRNKTTDATSRPEALSQGSQSRHSDTTRTKVAGSDSSSDTGGRARVRRSMRRARRRLAEERGHAHPAGETSARKVVRQVREERRSGLISPPVSPAGSHPRATELLRKGVLRDDEVTPILSTVGGVSLLATFVSKSRLERALNMGDGWFRLVLGRVPGMSPQQRLQLVIRLPDGSMVQSTVEVLRLGSTRMLLQAAPADPMTLAILRNAI